eukprot:6704824-Pyramimonas_sp.AAC.2
MVRGSMARPTVERLSRVGTNQNASSGMLKLLRTIGLPQLLTPLEGDGIKSSALLPSTLVRVIHKGHPWEFKTRLGANPDRVR